jgi:hypothetical protein
MVISLPAREHRRGFVFTRINDIMFGIHSGVDKTSIVFPGRIA